uniref:Uncharacterized protein n=1 Tax=Dunaliella tertiolecta TaxID=3047 RepID=A0A6S8L6T5_DUNTE
MEGQHAGGDLWRILYPQNNQRIHGTASTVLEHWPHLLDRGKVEGLAALMHKASKHQESLGNLLRFIPACLMPSSGQKILRTTNSNKRLMQKGTIEAQQSS